MVQSHLGQIFNFISLEQIQVNSLNFVTKIQTIQIDMNTIFDLNPSSDKYDLCHKCPPCIDFLCVCAEVTIFKFVFMFFFL